MCGLFWGAHKSLPPRARTLLGGLGHATLSSFAVASLLFVLFGVCPKFCDLAKQRRKIVGGVSEVRKDDFSLCFFWRCVIFLVFYFSSAAIARPPTLRGPGVRAVVGVCGSPAEQREGRGMGGDCAVGCVVSVYVSARRGALAWPVVGRAVWRRSLPSSAAAARISQTSLRIWCTSWSVVGRGYASFGLRPTRLRTLWMAWYPEVRDCCGLGGGVWPRVRARFDLCVGGGDGPNPGHSPRGWPAALDPVGQAEHGQSQVPARLP